MKDTEQFIEQERRAEQAALPFVYGVSFTDCLRINGIATEIALEEKVTQAHRVYGAWNAFLRAEGLVTSEVVMTKTKKGKEKEVLVVKKPMSLMGEGEELMEKMYTWTTMKYGAVYKAIKKDEEKEWLRTIIRFVVTSRIMENKYHQWITLGQGFADESVAQKMAEVYRFRYEMPSVARLIHATLLVHKDREAEDWEKRLAQEVITGVFDRLRRDRLGTLPPIEKGELLISRREAI
jgi:hypothetical protein